jgi:hypothetical protein
MVIYVVSIEVTDMDGIVVIGFTSPEIEQFVAKRVNNDTLNVTLSVSTVILDVGLFV